MSWQPGVAAGWAFLRLPSLRVTALARAGLTWLMLEAGPQEYTNQDDLITRPMAGVGARLDSLLLRAGAGVRLWFWASGLVDWMWAPPSFDPGFLQSGRREMNALQPRLAVGLSLEGG